MPSDPSLPAPISAGIADEVEIWWGGYSGWTMLPGFAVCLILTIGMIGSAWYLYSEENVNGDRARYAVYVLALTMWAVQIARWAYRITTINYRLTTRRLFHIRAINPRAVAVIDLADIQHVKVEQTLVEQQLGVGQLRVVAAKQTIELPGVRDPQRMANLIEKQAAAAHSQKLH